MVQRDARCLIFAPHPDDECIIGGLPLRLMRQLDYQVINVPITFGSKVSRREGRVAELADACAYLGWGIDREPAGTEPMDGEGVAAVLKRWQPRVIVMPHNNDWNKRHISTHYAVFNGLRLMGPEFECLVAECEFWGAMDDPNLTVELDCETLADLVAATALHVEEVNRNPYHLVMPAWMQDNVRRGAELVGGQGAEAPDFDFATLYRLRRWQNNGFAQVLTQGAHVPASTAPLPEIFAWK